MEEFSKIIALIKIMIPKYKNSEKIHIEFREKNFSKMKEQTRIKGVSLMSKNNNNVSIVLSGGAGQGIATVEQVLLKVFKLSGLNVFATREYMSRIRGGNNSTEIRVSSDRVNAFVDRIDVLVLLNKGSFTRLKSRVTSQTIIVGEPEFIEDECRMCDDILDVPFAQLAVEAGGKLFTSIVAAGFIIGLLNIHLESLQEYLRHRFSAKGDDIVSKNLIAAEIGYNKGLTHAKEVTLELQSRSSVKNELLINGTEAVSIGAIAGGCNFISAYPMSPSTGVLTFLSQQSRNFGIIVDQAEDEIAGINKAIGAWYAGGRALANTSGGGFALMEEGLSLSVALEMPLVVHIAQRPGPATGLPTRTEQGDLELALYAGHGEFPRVIFAPGTIQDGFYLTQKAFNLADKYQIPVFILTDQYYMNTYYNLPMLDLSEVKVDHYFVKTDKTYNRYQLTEDGISPRGIPGYGDGIVKVDSHEHTEDGHLTEDPIIRTNMVDKRLKKLDALHNEAIPPELIGKDDYKVLIIAWGSTYHIIQEAVSELAREGIAFLHFKQVYPLHSNTEKYLRKAEKTIVIENNATSQFRKLLKLHTGIEIHHSILKYSGHPFSVEELITKITEIL